jgi:hypothetical protein
MTTLVSTDGYVEKSSRAFLIKSTKIHEIYCAGAPCDVRIYFLTPRISKASASCGGIPASASGILTLLTKDDTTYGQAISLATSLQNTLFDSPSLVRAYKIIKVTPWKRLDPVKNKVWRFTQTSTYPKLLDSGSDKLSDLWLYLPKSVIPIIEFRGFMGTEVNQMLLSHNTDAFVVGNAYTTNDLGKINTETTATHLNVSKAAIIVRTTSIGDLKLESDETREISNVLDVTPSGVQPNYFSTAVTGYQVT